jgi:uracil-DNA glycosylase
VIYVPAYGPTPADWMLVGEAPGQDEENNTVSGVLTPRPFVGISGRLLDGMLVNAGLPRTHAYVTNVSKFRPPKNKIEEWFTESKAKAERNGLKHFTNGMYYNDEIKSGLEELYADIEKVRPKVIVALGNTPLWALTGEMGITKWRGSELWYGDARLIPTLHPAAVLRAMETRHLVVHDLRYRVMGKMVNPELGREPQWDFQTGRDFPVVMQRLNDLLDRLRAGQHPYLSVDVETKRGRIDCAGFAWSERSALCVPLVDAGNTRIWRESEERAIGELVRLILTFPGVKIIGQNFNYDAQYFVRDPAVSTRVVCSHDTKVAQHVLLPGTDKDLVTLSSLYCDWHSYWKDDLKESAENMDDEKRWRYNCRDCCVTYEVAMKQLPLLKKEGFV